MAKSQTTFNKREKEKERLKKRQEKLLRKEDRKQNASGGDFESMLAYVDEFGNITDTPPDPSRKKLVDVNSIEISIPKREESEPSIISGRVEFFDDSKGFGFIRETESQEKYFVHASGLLEKIAEGDIVTFDLERGMKGMNAVRVQKLKA